MKPYDFTHSSPSWIRVYLSILFVFVLVAVLAQLSGCAGMNAATSAGLTQVEADAYAAAMNVQKINNAAFQAWQLQAGSLTLGAIGRNASGNPDAVQAALMAAGVRNVGVVGIQNGQVFLTTGQATPAAVPATPAVPATATTTPSAMAPSTVQPAPITTDMLKAAPAGSVLVIPKASP